MLKMKKIPCSTFVAFFALFFLTGSIPGICASPESDKIFTCNSITIKDCVGLLEKQHSIKIELDPSLATQKVTARIDGTQPSDALMQIMVAAGINNFALTKDSTGKGYKIALFGKLQNKETPGAKNEDVKQNPSFQEQVDALIAKSKTLKPIDPNTVVVLPNGKSTSLQEMVTQRDRADVSPGAYDVPLTHLNESMPSLTLKDLQEMQRKAEEAAKEKRDVTLIDGRKITSDQIKELHDKTPPNTGINLKNIPTPGSSISK